MELSPDQLRRLRLRAQGLQREPDAEQGGPLVVVRRVCAVQAQEAPAAALSLWARGDGFTAGDVERALAEERNLARNWLFRGTLHQAAAEDLGWLLPLLGPRFIRKTRRRYAELGLDETVRRKSLEAIREILIGGAPVTRTELTRRLAARGFPTEGQAAYHLMHHAGLSGVLCFGPDQDGEETFVLLEEWFEIGEALPDEEALLALARRYLRAYAPAAPQDLAAWSGLTLTQALAAFRALADELVEAKFAGETLWLLDAQEPWLGGDLAEEANLRLLPRYDTYLLGYRDRDLSVPAAYAKRIHPGGGFLHAAVLVDGLAAGTWRMTRQEGRLNVIVEPFEPLKGELVRRLEAEVDELGRFLDVEARLELMD